MVTTNEKTTKKHNFNRRKNEDQQEIKSENTFCNAREDENVTKKEDPENPQN
jgi:hypothetical protein